MSSVTKRISEIKQPRGGYVNPSMMRVTVRRDGKTLSDNENLHSSIIGLTIDYMTRFMMGEPIERAFEVPLQGAERAKLLRGIDTNEEIDAYKKNIRELDDKSIYNACKLVTYDVWYRNIAGALNSKTAADTNPDLATINNIRIMIERSLSFWDSYGPIVKSGFTFEEKGYTSTVDSGDGDYLTEDSIWDFKVSKHEPKSDHTLQLLMYYVMGKHSEKEEFKSICKVGIFNPRLNKVYQMSIKLIPARTIRIIEKDIICY